MVGCLLAPSEMLWRWLADGIWALWEICGPTQWQMEVWRDLMYFIQHGIPDQEITESLSSILGLSTTPSHRTWGYLKVRTTRSFHLFSLQPFYISHFHPVTYIHTYNLLSWKGPLSGIWSNSPAMNRDSSIGCSEPHPG